jgi:hypothetical protein
MKLGGLSRRTMPPTSGNVLHPQPEGDAQHGVWAFVGNRTDGGVARGNRSDGSSS